MSSHTPSYRNLLPARYTVDPSFLDLPVRSACITLISLASLVLLSGCEPVFNPLKESDRYAYSINGLLDASADTQWVRLSVIRDSLRIPDNPGPPDAEVKIEHLESGETVTLQDTLLSFRGTSSSGGTRTYNYFTSMAIDPEQSYRLTATGPEGQASYATIRLPPDYSAPEFTGATLVYNLEDIGVVVDASLVFYYRNVNTGEIRKEVLPKLGLISETRITNRIIIRLSGEFSHDYDYILERLTSEWPIIKMGVFTAYGGVDWPPFTQLSDLEQQVPDAASNVNGGVGFVGGIISHFLPICFGEERFVPCPEEDNQSL